MPTTAVSKLAFRPVTADDVATCAAMEAASYPADEAASPQGLRYRQAEAGAYFRCAIDKASDEIVGFVCGTRCTSFTHESMATHHPQGRLLAIHSVVVREDCRRQGLARQMLQDYLAHIEAAEAAAAVVPSSKSVVPPPLEKVVLLAKSHLLGFYVQCGLTVTRVSPIVHGQELWYELEKQVPTTSLLSPRCFVVDSFGQPARRGTGNPAAVVLLDQAPADNQNTTLEEWMQTVAAEFNLSETAFVWPLQHHLEQQTYGIRFFTPTMPVALCGHATLAAASILYQTGLVPTDQTVTFEASQDVLQATCVDEDATQIRMVLPAKPALALSTEADRQIAQSMLHEAFGLEEEEILWLGLSPEVGDLLVQVASADWIRALGTTGSINYDAMRTTALPSYTRGIILSSLAAAAAVFTNPDDTTDTHFGSRFFAPKAGILEDPVTGSAQAILMPHYAHLLGASELRAEQWSSRGGWLTCRLLADKVEISGRAVTTLEGRLQ